LALVVGIPITVGGLALALAALFCLAFALTSLGFVLAWRMESIHGFHGIVNLILMPMWFLSGALFPIAGAVGWLQTIMRLNPVAYGLVSFRNALYGTSTAEWVGPGLAWVLTIAFAVVMFAIATRSMRR
jgi:ABC-2 type transport system permease protein